MTFFTGKIDNRKRYAPKVVGNGALYRKEDCMESNFETWMLKNFAIKDTWGNISLPDNYSRKDMEILFNARQPEIDELKKQLAKFKAFYFAYREIILNMCNDEEEAECIKSLQGLE